MFFKDSITCPNPQIQEFYKITQTSLGISINLGMVLRIITVSYQRQTKTATKLNCINNGNKLFPVLTNVFWACSLTITSIGWVFPEIWLIKLVNSADVLSCKPNFDPTLASKPTWRLYAADGSFHWVIGWGNNFLIVLVLVGNRSPNKTQGRQNAPSRLGE